MVKKTKTVGVDIGFHEVYTATFSGNKIIKKDTSIHDLNKISSQYDVVSTGISSPQIIYKTVVLPSHTKNAEIKEAIKWQNIDIDNSQYELFYIKTDFVVEDSMTILSIAVPKKVITDFLDKHGNVFTNLSLRSLALWESHRLQDKSGQATILREDGIDTCIIVCGRQTIEYASEMPIYDSDTEVPRVIDFYSRAFAAEGCTVIDLNDDKYKYMAATGYALLPSNKDVPNLMYVPYLRAKKKTKIMSFLPAAAVALLLLNGAATYQTDKLNNLTTQMQNEINTATREMNSGRNNLDNLKAQIQGYQNNISKIDMLNSFSYAGLLADLSYAIPKDAILESVNMVYGAAAVGNSNSLPAPANVQNQPPGPSAGAPSTNGGNNQSGNANNNAVTGSSGSANNTQIVNTGNSGAGNNVPNTPNASIPNAPNTQNVPGMETGAQNNNAVQNPPASNPSNNTNAPFPSGVTGMMDMQAQAGDKYAEITGYSLSMGSVGVYMDNISLVSYIDKVEILSVRYDDAKQAYYFQFKLSFTSN